MESNLGKDDFAILTGKIADIEPNSVCVVESVQKDTINVFFQGAQKRFTVPKNLLKYLDYKNTGEKSKNPGKSRKSRLS